MTNTGPTTVLGDLGVSPSLAITGFPPGMVTGVIHAGDAVALQAQSDLTTAYNTAAGLPCANDMTGMDLGGLTLTAGVYCFSSSAQLTGALTLDAEGDPDASFVFQIGSTLTTASSSTVLMINGAQGCNVFWQVGSSATLGTATTFVGNILALTSISLTTGVQVEGRALARNGAVTMDTNHLEVGACTTGVDGGTPETDAATSDAGGDVDGGTPVMDGGPPGMDGGPPGMDGGPPGMDGGPPGMDGGPPGMDGGPPGIDGGPPGMDGGPPGMDGGPPGMDGGPPAVDGGSPGMDGGPMLDGGGALDGGLLCCVGESCGTISCHDLDVDNDNCGACGNVCPANSYCNAGSCTTCTTQCGGVCADLAWDPNNCGACGNDCAPTEYCDSGSCVVCANVCDGRCTDVWHDDANCGACGNACAPTQVCTDGTCDACLGGAICDGACTDLETDAAHCGSCDTACGLGGSCVLGACVCL